MIAAADPVIVAYIVIGLIGLLVTVVAMRLYVPDKDRQHNR